MESFVDGLIQVVFKAVDIPFVLGIIIVIEILKKLIKLKKKKLWTLVLISFGFGAAFLKVFPFDYRIFIIQGFIYIAACELLYQVYQTIILVWKNKGKNK